MSNLAAPFDQGVFLLHHNRGREAFQEGRYAEARRELESAQKLRPDDADVLNLLGLVYFKTNAYPEAEVIYRLGIRVGLEVDEAEEIENVRVIGTQFLRALQLP